jgi:hypothetical protein
MRNKIVLITACFLCSSTFALKPSVNQKDYLQFSKIKRAAIYDYNNKKMKYYHFGLLPLSEKTKKLFTKNNIKIINKNCIVIPELACYNKIILEKTHIKI